MQVLKVLARDGHRMSRTARQQGHSAQDRRDSGQSASILIFVSFSSCDCILSSTVIGPARLRARLCIKCHPNLTTASPAKICKVLPSLIFQESRNAITAKASKEISLPKGHTSQHEARSEDQLPNQCTCPNQAVRIPWAHSHCFLAPIILLSNLRVQRDHFSLAKYTRMSRQLLKPP